MKGYGSVEFPCQVMGQQKSMKNSQLFTREQPDCITLLESCLTLSISRYIFRNIDPETGWAVRTTALNTAARLGKDLEHRLPISSDTGDTVSLLGLQRYL